LDPAQAAQRQIDRANVDSRHIERALRTLVGARALLGQLQQLLVLHFLCFEN
jgi:hypothetical protein